MRLFQVGHVVQTRRSLFSLAWHERLSCKGKEGRFSATGWRFRQNLKYENFPSSFGRPRQKIVPKSVLHVQHDYFSSFNLLICDVVVDVAETPYNRHLPSDQGPVAPSMISANHWGRSIGTYIFIW